MGIRLVIADDHPVVRDGLRGMLAGQSEFEIVGEAATGAEAVAVVAKERPDVVLMDLRMPSMDGVAATSRIAAEHPATHVLGPTPYQPAAPPATPVLVLTTYDTDADILRAVEAGATGYLLKDTPRQDLFAAVRAAARGETVLAPAVAARLFGHMRAPADEALTA